MEKEFNHQSGQVREERKDEIVPQTPTTAVTTKSEAEAKETGPLGRKKRIRAYQRIDYWQ